MKELSIIIPAYNEEKRITSFLLDYIEYFETRFGNNFEIIIITDGCTDSTPQIVEEFAKRYEYIKHVSPPQRLGKGGAIILGFKLAKGRIIGFVDGDGSVPVKSLEMLLNHMKGWDGVIASRWVKGAVVGKKQPLKRRVASRAFNLLVRALFHLPFKDTQCGAKFFRRRAVKAVVDELGLTDWAFDVDLLYRMNKKGFKIKEVPITWNHIEGSKLNLRKVTIKMFFAVVGLRIKDSCFSCIIPPALIDRIYEWVRKL